VYIDIVWSKWKSYNVVLALKAATLAMGN
jgi:hypothetical protein